jgi:hypothetical protein
MRHQNPVPRRIDRERPVVVSGRWALPTLRLSPNTIRSYLKTTPK